MKFQPGGPDRYDHQKRGLQKLLKTGGVGALLFDPGTGKTGTTLDYLSILALKLEGGEARVLVIAPLAAVDTWVIQARQFVSPQVDFWVEALGGSLRERAHALAARGGQPFRGSVPKRHKGAPRSLHWKRSIAWDARAEGRERAPTITEGPDGVGPEHTGRPRLVIEVINFDSLSSRQRISKSRTMADLMLEGIKRYRPDAVVVDESHKIKSASSNVSAFMDRLSRHVPRRILLTGTVMPHGPLDVFGQWRFLAPYDLGKPKPGGTTAKGTLGDFEERYVVHGGFMGKEVVGYKNLDHLQRTMSRRAAVARKEDSLDLPTTTEVIVPVHLTADEDRAYREMKQDLATRLRGEDASAGNRLVQGLRLRQVTSGYLPDDAGRVHELGGSKVKVIQSIVQDNLAGEKRIVIFCLFSHEIEMLTRVLSVKGTEVMRIEGGTSSEERMAMRRRFGSDDPARIVMVAQIKTMSLAVNELVTANHAIFGSLSQQRDDLVQARDRLNRIGQKRPVTYWYALAPRTVDEVIFQSHQDRTNLENAVLRHILDSE